MMIYKIPWNAASSSFHSSFNFNREDWEWEWIPVLHEWIERRMKRSPPFFPTFILASWLTHSLSPLLPSFCSTVTLLPDSQAHPITWSLSLLWAAASFSSTQTSSSSSNGAVNSLQILFFLTSSPVFSSEKNIVCVCYFHLVATTRCTALSRVIVTLLPLDVCLWKGRDHRTMITMSCWTLLRVLTIIITTVAMLVRDTHLHPRLFIMRATPCPVTRQSPSWLLPLKNHEKWFGGTTSGQV